jgi:hypothetical protein
MPVAAPRGGSSLTGLIDLNLGVWKPMFARGCEGCASDAKRWGQVMSVSKFFTAYAE